MSVSNSEVLVGVLDAVDRGSSFAALPFGVAGVTNDNNAPAQVVAGSIGLVNGTAKLGKAVFDTAEKLGDATFPKAPKWLAALAGSRLEGAAIASSFAAELEATGEVWGQSKNSKRLLLADLTKWRLVDRMAEIRR